MDDGDTVKIYMNDKDSNSIFGEIVNTVKTEFNCIEIIKNTHARIDLCGCFLILVLLNFFQDRS